MLDYDNLTGEGRVPSLNVCVGFIWYMPKGAFHSFPYLHIISVKEEHRCKGIGKKLMDFLEEIVFVNDNKIFLVVADYNPDAKRFYEKIGYQQVGEIPSLYRKGITEYLMMKEREMLFGTYLISIFDTKIDT